METHDWLAWYNRMPGANDVNLRVVGHVGLPSSNATAALVPGNEGIVDEPDLYVLELVVEVPDIGDTQFVDREVTWADDVGPDIQRVRIQGAADVALDVTIAV